MLKKEDEIINEKPVTLSIGELKRLCLSCDHVSCGRFATIVNVNTTEKLCDECGNGNFGFIDMRNADVIRSIQARIDGLLAETTQTNGERWVVVFTDNNAEFGPSFETRTEADIYAASVKRLFHRGTKVVML